MKRLSVFATIAALLSASAVTLHASRSNRLCPCSVRWPLQPGGSKSIHAGKRSNLPGPEQRRDCMRISSPAWHCCTIPNQLPTVISTGDGDTLRVRQGGKAVTVRIGCVDAPEIWSLD